jgi:hypothetical protein
VQFIILRDGILSLILSSKEGQNFDHTKAWMQKGCQGEASWVIKYATLVDKLHKYGCKEYNGAKQLKHRDADFCWMCSGQLALVVIMLLQTAVGCVPANWH